MNEQEVHQNFGQRVDLNYKTGGVHATGRLIGYCDAPSVLIETEQGEKIWWRADITSLVEPDTRPKCVTCDHPAEPNESRFCPEHQDHMPVCQFDHCIECGAAT